MDWYNLIGKPVIEIVTAVGTLVALGALVVTVRKNGSDEEDRKQQVILDQCKRTLEWAYNALMPDHSAQLPEANRLNWLTAARHILAYQEIRKGVNREPYSRIVEDFEEFWRHRFYLALSDMRLSRYSYWSAPDPQLVNIDFTSALVVVDFSGWPEGKADPAELTDDEREALSSRNGFKGNAGRGLKQYLGMIEQRYGKGTPSPTKRD